MMAAIQSGLAVLGYALSVVAMGHSVVALVTWRRPDGVPGDPAARFLLHLKARASGRAASHLLAFPVRDILSLGLWSWSFAANCVVWRGDRYRVTAGGSFQLIDRI